MNQSVAPLDSLLLTIVLATLAVSLPILFVMAIRFLWDRSLSVGRSKELEKLIWQLHRIASAMEHQMNLKFPAVQPGTEEPRDLAFLQPLGAQPAKGTPTVATPGAAAAMPATHLPGVQQPVAPQPAVQQASVAPPVPLETPAEAPRHAGVNSMFGF
jgi:hypothetical protein